MTFTTLDNALSVLGEASVKPRVREEAHQFLNNIDPDVKLIQLVEALRSDNFKVQWEAAKLLSEMGRPALNGILRALVDPKKVGDQRLRNGAYHVLHNHTDPFIRQVTAPLLTHLHGSLADLRTMYEADHLLQEIAGR